MVGHRRMQIDFSTLLFAAILTITVAVLGERWLSRRRHRELSRQRFLAFVQAWESEVRIGFHSSLGLHGRVAELFLIRSPSFAAEQVPMQECYGRGEKWKEFRILCDRISIMTLDQIDSREGNSDLLSAVRALISFVVKN